MTELTKPVSRKVHVSGKGDFVVTLTKAGVSIRKARKRKTVTLPYDQLALRALEQGGWMLNAKEWSDPLTTLGKLKRLRKTKRVGSPRDASCADGGRNPRSAAGRDTWPQGGPGRAMCRLDPPAIGTSRQKGRSAARGNSRKSWRVCFLPNGVSYMKIELRKLADIRPYENNPRINDDAVDAVAASIREFGFRQPIVVDTEGVIIVGHTRYKAAQKLGLEKVPVHVAKDLTPEQIRAYRIADNKTAELAEWNYDLLPIELSQLGEAGFDLQLLGFDQDELAKLLDPGVKDGLTDPDDVPEPPDAAITQPGDLWILGDHRLLCGDSSKPEHVDRLLAGAEHPSGEHRPAVQREGRTPQQQRHRGRPQLVPGHHASPGAGPRAASGEGEADPQEAAGQGPAAGQRLRVGRGVRPAAARVVREHGPRAVARSRLLHLGRVRQLCELSPGAEGGGLYFSQAIIWDKEHPVLTRKDFMGNHEWCFYGWKEGAAHVFFGPNNAADLWHVKKVNPQSMDHLTEKPVELAVRAMQYSSRAGENVLDLFGGSGSTLIAAEQTGRGRS